MVYIYILILNIFSNTYELEKNLAIKSIKVLSTDNTKGVYTKLVEPFVEEYFNSQTRFYYYGFNYINKPLSENDLFNDNNNVDAVLHLDLISIDDILNIELTLYIANTKEKYVYEFYSFKKDSSNSINKNDFISFIKKSLNKIPFKAIVLSRFEGDLLIIDIGKSSNIKVNNKLNVYKIVKVNKHPYLNTIISLERQKVGEIKIFKVEENISFANIVYEDKKNPILEFYKIFIDAYSNNAELLINPESQEQEKFLFFNINKNEVLSYSKLTDTSLGSYSVSIPFSFFSYKATNNNSDIFNKNTSFSTGFKLDASIYITEFILLESSLKYQLQSFEPEAGTSSFLNSSYRDFYVYLAYKYDLNYTNTFFLKSGYRSFKFSSDDVPIFSPHTNKKYQALILDFNYETIINPFVSLNIAMYLSLFDSLKETPIKNDVLNNNIFGLSINSAYKLNARQSLIYGLYYDRLKSSFKNSNLISSSIVNKGLYLGVEFVF